MSCREKTAPTGQIGSDVLSGELGWDLGEAAVLAALAPVAGAGPAIALIREDIGVVGCVALELLGPGVGAGVGTVVAAGALTAAGAEKPVAKNGEDSGLSGLDEAGAGAGPAAAAADERGFAGDCGGVRCSRHCREVTPGHQ